MNKFADRRMPLCLSASWLRSLAWMAALTSLLSQRAFAQSNDFDLRWGGNVFDVFTIDGNEAWTVEDGGRIRHRDPISGNWSFQNVPSEVKDTVHRIFFLPGTSGAQTGWAVAADGSVLKTFDSGSTWTRVAQFNAVLPGKGPFEVLYSVHFIDANHGWIAGLHGIWYTEQGGDANEWFPATLKLADGSIPTTAQLEEIEFYELDAVTDPDPEVEIIVGTPILGLASAEPGLVFRSRNGREWEVVWDLLDHCAEVAQTCAVDVCAAADPDIWEPWDIEISRNTAHGQKLALMAGGIIFQCGLIWRSTDDGTTWVREEHECLPCGGTPCATCPSTSYLDETIPPPAPGAPPDNTIYKFMRMRTIYSLDIVEEDNSALAVGYNGQVLWRNPITQIWEDRSHFSANYVSHPTPDLVHVSALFGVSTNGVAGTGRVAFSTGLGGSIRRSTDGGVTWPPDSNTVKGQPYRSHDVDFRDPMIGWMVGQFSRIARTPDAATNWFEATPLPDAHAPPLHAIAFADNSRGVAVGGDSGSSLSPEGEPRMLYTITGGSSGWIDVSGAIDFAPPGTFKFGSLRDVAYVPGTTIVWAGGDFGFLARSNVNGSTTWRQMLINGSQIMDFEINGIDFKDSSTGLFVGRDTTQNVALVWQLKVSGTGVYTWSTVTVVPAGAPVSDLGDVEVLGNDAYAVGETLTAGGARQGIVLKATFNASTGSFGDFVPFSPANQFPKCTVGSNLREGVGPPGSTVPVLNRIAIAPNGHLWVGGECGRVWRYDSSNWTEYKSQTDTNILGITFPTSTEGFFVGYRYNETSQALVRYQ